MSLLQTSRDLRMRPVHDLNRAEQLRVLAIRNQAEVRKNMYTDHQIGESEHFHWLDGLRSNDRTRFFAVIHEGEIIGGVGLNAISHADRRADWAFYLDTTKQGRGIGSALEFMFLDYAMGEFQKLNCEVLAFNAPVIRLHEKFGFIREGVRRRHILRDGEYHDAHLLGITAEEWQQRRVELMEGVFRER